VASSATPDRWADRHLPLRATDRKLRSRSLGVNGKLLSCLSKPLLGLSGFHQRFVRYRTDSGQYLAIDCARGSLREFL